MLGWSDRLFLLCLHGTAVAPSASSEVCLGVQHWKSAGNGRLLDPHRTNQPHQTLALSRTTTFLRCLLLQSRAHAVFLARGAIILGFLSCWDSSGRRTHSLCPRILPGWCPDSPFRRTSRSQRRRESPSLLTSSNSSLRAHHICLTAVTNFTDIYSRFAHEKRGNLVFMHELCTAAFPELRVRSIRSRTATTANYKVRLCGAKRGRASFF